MKWIIGAIIFSAIVVIFLIRKKISRGANNALLTRMGMEGAYEDEYENGKDWNRRDPTPPKAA